jgi:hypothetical protein
MRPSEAWENLADVLRVIQPELEAKLSYCRNHPSDPVLHPVTTAILAAYMSRLESELATIRGGAAAMKKQERNEPLFMQELEEMESWILRRKRGVPRRQLAAKDEDALGNWFVSKMGLSYSKTKRMLQNIRRRQSGKGAPSMRTETLGLLDARISNRWTYKELVAHRCDCGAQKHDAHCVDRIRKRISELESFLAKYQIAYPRPAR